MVNTIAGSSAASAETKDHKRLHGLRCGQQLYSGTASEPSVKLSGWAKEFIVADDDTREAAEQTGPVAEAKECVNFAAEEVALNAENLQSPGDDDCVDHPNSDFELYDEYDEQGTKTTAIPGCLFTSKTSEVSQKPSTNLAFDGFGMTYQSLLDNFGCNSLNNKRANIVGTVRYAYQYMNAILDGVQVKFSGGDGTVFINFTDSINLVAHEWTHGLIYNTCRLGYLKQARAHNKSLANVMSSIVKQLYYNKTAADATCLMGSGTLKCYKAFYYSKHLAQPIATPMSERTPQSAHVRNFENTE
ncbi:MAG: hypothetical protein Q9175_006244 [Cornicularia normoerica]